MSAANITRIPRVYEYANDRQMDQEEGFRHALLLRNKEEICRLSNIDVLADKILSEQAEPFSLL